MEDTLDLTLSRQRAANVAALRSPIAQIDSKDSEPDGSTKTHVQASPPYQAPIPPVSLIHVLYDGWISGKRGGKPKFRPKSVASPSFADVVTVVAVVSGMVR